MSAKVVVAGFLAIDKLSNSPPAGAAFLSPKSAVESFPLLTDDEDGGTLKSARFIVF